MKILNSIRLIRAGVLAAAAAGMAGTAFSVSAEEVNPDSIVSITAEINAAGHVKVSQPEKLTSRLVRKKAASQETVSDADGTRIETAASRRQASSVRAGYRVQVFDDNNPRTARQTASSLKSKIESAFPAYRAYVSFNSPYWRVKTGDFRSRAEAESAMAEIRRAFPELKAYIRIVRDRVNIYD
ncbi:MAG: SPOR domain-containing protein [Muribaculaceae bacterium]|nr:SPOR domain-containing protein [Muribaculaceae bacterium]